ncbi:hypothetical protein FCN77_16280 [Arthrobacter sp. 24S4-2]|uniref:hypothetical protein n=1 Tax=Arthrobacter sp. 24S4-2 TaxID=2575374 RepID=UPI0010C7A4DA|nr:hypothetical protein [Arthrobacter sp. 24S4-2]QCO98972.1 hypothetical protein FCN77_16280 [Arthrobacter sp. 24S4-2]
MALTDPFLSDVDLRIRQSVEHVYSATAYPVSGPPIALDVEDLSITFDESWSPFIQADITAKVPEDQATLDALDPRKNCRVKISAGYVYDGKTQDVHQIADLHLRTREVLRPANELRLTASSDEARAQDAKRRSTDAVPPKTGINEIVTYAATKAVYPDVPEIVSDFPPGYGVNSFTELALDVSNTFDSLMTDAAGRAGVWVYAGEDRRWHITTRAAEAGVSAHKLYTGPDGTIFDADTALQREDFFNSVILTYTWKDGAGVDQTIYGEAYVPSTGTYGVDAIGWNTYVEDRQGPITQAQATAAAQTVLKYKITRGRGIRIQSLAAYWCRPGMTATIQLPTGDLERQIIRAVTFHPPSGSMSITTRQPETVSIS